MKGLETDARVRVYVCACMCFSYDCNYDILRITDKIREGGKKICSDNIHRNEKRDGNYGIYLYSCSYK